MSATEEQTTERPSIFNGWSIRRIFANEKTQTRRIMKPQPEEVDPPNRQTWTPERKWLRWKKVKQTSGALTGRCPYGQRGDVLWVREAFRMPERFDDQYTPKEYVSHSGYTQGIPGYARYEADEKRVFEVAGNPDAPSFEWGRLRPAIHMPRELCRLRLRVESVRVERLQEISHHAAEAEGVRVCNPQETPRDLFRMKWNDIHSTGAWEENPHVWVVEFSKIDAE